MKQKQSGGNNRQNNMKSAKHEASEKDNTYKQLTVFVVTLCRDGECVPKLHLMNLQRLQMLSLHGASHKAPIISATFRLYWT